MEENKQTVKEHCSGRFTKFYIVMHSLVFSLASVALVVAEIKFVDFTANNYLNEFFVTSTALNVTIGVFCFLIAFIPLPFCK
jgi:hypothetical protein